MEKADIVFHSHPYAGCPHCNEEQEVQSDKDVDYECAFCHGHFSYDVNEVY